MATKFVLHGGNISDSPDKGKGLFSELTKGLDDPKVLLCYFSRAREDWESDFDYHSQIINSFWDKKPKLGMAMPDVFEEQLKKSDIVMFYGGDDELITHWARKIRYFAESLKGKIIGGSSAGADLFVKKYWTGDWREVRDGIGLVDANIMTHYGSAYGSDDPRGPIDWGEAEKELQKAIGSNETILKIREGKFVTIEL